MEGGGEGSTACCGWHSTKANGFRGQGTLGPKKEIPSRSARKSDVNNMSTKHVQEVKVDQITRLENRYGADAWGISKHGINPQKRPESETMDSYFDTKVQLRSVSSSNINEKTSSNHVPGETAILATNIPGGYIKRTGTDSRKLGRYSWMLLEGAIGHKTRVIQVYAIDNNNSKELGSTYQQSLRYIQSSGIQSTPKDLLINDLAKQLQTWQHQGDQLLTMADCNGHILTGSFGKALTGGKWDLDVSEVLHRAWGNRPPNTHIRGKIPIDGV